MKQRQPRRSDQEWMNLISGLACIIQVGIRAGIWTFLRYILIIVISVIFIALYTQYFMDGEKKAAMNSPNVMKKTVVPQSTTPAKKFCGKCGKELASDATFCGYCGEKLK